MKKQGFNFIHIIICALCILAPLFTTTASPKEKTLGVLGGYNTRNRAPLAGVSFSYRILPHVRITPNIRYTFRNQNHDAYVFAVDFHFPYQIAPVKNIMLYPIVGVAYTSNNTRMLDDVSTRMYRFGMNTGAGGSIDLTNSLRLSLEGRYLLVRSIPTGQVSLGISYCF